ncbi:hypothetical protein GCM10023193_17310 [Planotetraspora kaengkrachanensis]|uniref:Transglycosylase SLT domain-containing protein n=1 Tax=Planotetraspora kaengkrachanensis TaxID=575193 RepID=A0A8J3LWM7_9ACTN|nr:hypothetical protein Pka01_29190 [Planotetraspora kaengkrachanensis]
MAGLTVLIAGIVAGGFVLLGSAGEGEQPVSAGATAPVPVPGSPSASAEIVPDPALPSSPPVADAAVRVTPPSMMAIAPAPVSADTLRAIAALKNVREVAGADGGAVRASGRGLQLLAVDPTSFRSWTPKPVADKPEVWSALARDEVVADSGTVDRTGMVLGAEYQIDGGPQVRLAASAPLGLPGVDGLVSIGLGRRLGLAPGVVVLIHTDHGTADRRAVGRLLGKRAQIVTVGAARTPVVAPSKPASTSGLVGRPGSYLELYQRAATTCPGLSWTVLAAIGQVESGHGRNNGPSSAGALGPMQFMPATWEAYGFDGDGDGEKDIWSPYDAVPAAAKYLCANGAGRGGDKLRKSVWFYNHSWSYVDKVLGLAGAYARRYP